MAGCGLGSITSGVSEFAIVPLATRPELRNEGGLRNRWALREVELHCVDTISPLCPKPVLCRRCGVSKGFSAIGFK